jgi:hypothetical protein
MTRTYYVEVDSADVPGVRDAVLGLGDSGVHLSAILPLADGKKTMVNWWSDREQAEQAASRLTQAGFLARAKPHGQGAAQERLAFTGIAVRAGDPATRPAAAPHLPAAIACGVPAFTTARATARTSRKTRGGR